VSENCPYFNHGYKVAELIIGEETVLTGPWNELYVLQSKGRRLDSAEMPDLGRLL